MNEALIKRLEAATDKLEKLANAGANSQRAATQPAGCTTATGSIAGFEDLTGSSLQAYLTASSNVDSLVKEQVYSINTFVFLNNYSLDRQNWFHLVSLLKSKSSFKLQTLKSRQTNKTCKPLSNLYNNL